MSETLAVRPMPAPDTDSSPQEMHPVDSLTREHRVIFAVLDAIDAELSRSGPPRTAFWARAADFVHHFVELCHHGKEERALLPALLDTGRSERVGPVVVMKSEHVEGREFERRLAAALDGDGDLAPAANDYVTLMRQHMTAEEGGIFRLARESLQAEHLTALRSRFTRIETEILGRDGYATYMDLAAAVCAEHGISVDTRARDD